MNETVMLSQKKIGQILIGIGVIGLIIAILPVRIRMHGVSFTVFLVFVGVMFAIGYGVKFLLVKKNQDGTFD